MLLLNAHTKNPLSLGFHETINRYTKLVSWKQHAFEQFFQKYSSYEYFSSDQKIFQDIWYLNIWFWPNKTPEDINTHPEKYSSYEYFSSEQKMFQDFRYMNLQFWSIEILEDIKILQIKFLLVMSLFLIFWYPLFLWGYCDCTSIGMGCLCSVWFI